jgi:threonine synthase
MWRYDAVLPEAAPVTLGEGFTPMLRSHEYPSVFIKDEGLNPTGSFKARGLSAAVTMARHFGLKKLAIPSAGNAAAALAAYAAAANIEAHIFMPKDVPMANRVECDYYGAHVTLVDGLISDCARKVAELKGFLRGNTKDGSTFPPPRSPTASKARRPWATKSPNNSAGNFRKASSILLVVASACSACGRLSTNWSSSAFIGSERPNMISVQSSGCAPIVKAWDEGRPLQKCGLMPRPWPLACAFPNRTATI